MQGPGISPRSLHAGYRRYTYSASADHNLSGHSGVTSQTTASSSPFGQAGLEEAHYAPPKLLAIANGSLAITLVPNSSIPAMSEIVESGFPRSTNRAMKGTAYHSSSSSWKPPSGGPETATLNASTP